MHLLFFGNVITRAAPPFGQEHWLRNTPDQLEKLILGIVKLIREAYIDAYFIKFLLQLF